MNRIEKWNEITGAEQEQGMMEAFLESRTDSYAILQLRDIDETRREQFASLDYLHRQGKEPDIDHYEIVYTADLPTFTDRDVMLESLYTKFNIDHPADFTGHSLSVSDIVALKTGGVVSFHYVDFVGFTELKDFLRAGNHLKNAEMALEDDYGMIDGIINNGKAGAERERPSVYGARSAGSYRKNKGKGTGIMDFTQEERMLMMIYNPGSREELVVELETMKGQLRPGERRLLRLTDTVIGKLRKITDEEFERIDLYPDVEA